MNILYPPILERNLPPIQKQSTGYFLNIPFKNNIAVNYNSFTKILVRITGMSGNSYDSGYIITVLNNGLEIQDNKIYTLVEQGMKEAIAKIDGGLTDLVLNPGQFYKIQLAYGTEDSDKYVYSTVGTAKCIEISDTSPTVRILECQKNVATRAQSTLFTGEYYNKDGAERLLYYEFNVYDAHNNLYVTTGKLPHDAFLSNKDRISAIDGSITATDQFKLNKALKVNQTYSLEYICYTVNGLILKSYRYNIIDDNMIRPEINGFIVGIPNYEEGYISVQLQPNTVLDGAEPQSSTGAFKLLRASSIDDYTYWEEILNFQLVNQIPNLELWRDYTVEQGINYKYAVQQYNDENVYSSKFPSMAVMADFEDAFLFDGERQLNIKYNPKITNFKTNKIEGKTDTLGGKYPFITRNGYTNYKSFSISGLISTFMDQNQTFGGHDDTYTWDLDGINMKKERDFKLQILDWLNNGQPKLFKSPAEGNYIVLLQGVSLTPNDTLGRMLHTFSATAYEICDYSVANLKEYGLFKGEDIYSNSYNIESIIIKNITSTSVNATRRVIKPSASGDTFTYIIKFTGYRVDKLLFKDLPERAVVQIFQNNTSLGKYYIGRTHSLQVEGVGAITQIEITNIAHLTVSQTTPDLLSTASIDVSYQIPTKKQFKTLQSMATDIVVLQEVFGDAFGGTWLIGGSLLNSNNKSVLEPEDLVNKTRTTVINVNQLRLKTKDIDSHMYYSKTQDNVTNYYKDDTCAIAANLLKTPAKIYLVTDVSDNNNYFQYYLTFTIDGIPQAFSELDIRARVNNTVYNEDYFVLTPDDQMWQKDLTGISLLWIGNGVIADIGYPYSKATYLN